MSYSTLLESALALADDQKMELIEKLLETLGPETDGIDEAAFMAELNRRSDEIDQGAAELVGLVAPRPLTIKNAVDPAQQSVSKEEVERTYTACRAQYGRERAVDQFAVEAEK